MKLIFAVKALLLVLNDHHGVILITSVLKIINLSFRSLLLIFRSKVSCGHFVSEKFAV
jgi:hypothetical protein